MKIEVELSEEAIDKIAQRVVAIKKEKEVITYTVKQLCQPNMLNRSKRTVQQYFKEGVLQGSRVGTEWTITHENYLKYINGK